MTDIFEQHAHDVREGARFEFGENWRRFLDTLDDRRIDEAKRSLQHSLQTNTLKGLAMLDIGSGSGLFSLAGVLMGADRVHSFDFDPASVACSQELKRRFAPDANWHIEAGSALDRVYLASLGKFDLVYSWGVLHHTGDMWTAIDNAVVPLAAGGRLFISIYNDQGNRSRRWTQIKRIYNRLPRWLRTPYVIGVMGLREIRSAFRATIAGKPHVYVRGLRRYRNDRGMSYWRDAVDWCGGYPFEVAKPEEVIDFVQARGLRLVRLKTCGGGLGCNEYVFAGRCAGGSAAESKQP